ncbi:MAG TPA: alkene reductase [Burkholderiales bacterium]|nr:alkene reductase [Burkholderiales bacterium]
MKRENIDFFTAVKLGPYTLANRIVMAPMTRNRAGENDTPRQLNADYYRQRTSAGLIVTEASQISPQGKGYPATPGIYSTEQIEGWKRVTDAVHAESGRIFLQLWHVGRISHPTLQPDGGLPVAPSAIRPAGETFTGKGMESFVTPRALETGEIAGIVRDYAKGAANALAAGFDGVEIHAANGYLIDQFLRDESNLRTDRYGGSLENRARFLVEVTEAVAGAAGADRVGVRFSPVSGFNDMRDSNPQATFEYAAGQLRPLKLAYLHVVESREQPFDYRRLKEAFGGACIANGGYTRQRANQALANGDADLVAFGSMFLANPDLPARFARNAPLNEPDRSSFYGGTEKGYTDYPALTA